MENRFLLPCECGRQLAIDPGQTGQELTCACGRKLQAPGTLQELRKLPRARPDGAERPAAKWGEGPRAVFGCGTLILMVGIAMAGYFGYHWSKVRGTEKPDLAHAHDHQNFDELTPSQVLEIWQEWGHELPAERPKPAWIFWREVSAQFIFLMSIGGAIAIFGFATCAGAMWMASAEKEES